MTAQDLVHGERVLEVAGEYRSGEDNAYWDMYRDFLGCATPPPGSSHQVSKWSDFYTPQQLRNQPLYANFFRPNGDAHCLLVNFPTKPGFTRRVIFWRGPGSDFDERDRLILELLRPHLFELYRESRIARQDRPTLTQREFEVLELAAQGHSNADIARRLFISTGTVRKHMEHIFDRTGVRSRGAAVARLLP